MTLRQLKIFTSDMKSIKTEMIDKSYHIGSKNFSYLKKALRIKKQTKE